MAIHYYESAKKYGAEMKKWLDMCEEWGLRRDVAVDLIIMIQVNGFDLVESVEKLEG